VTRDARRHFSCPVELALELLGGKWKSVILARLKDGPLRYGELRARIPSLSDKVLSERLRDLEAQGLVVHGGRGKSGSPAQYALSTRGESLRPILQALYEWGTNMAGEVGASIDPPESTPGAH
jgi:DNA-binding HxlR family transcriptional regulator